MTAAEEVRAEAVKRYSSRLVEDYDGDRYDEDEHGYDATARSAFAAGAEWQASRPVTDDAVNGARRAWAASSPTSSGGYDSMSPTQQDRLTRRIRAALEAARGMQS